MAARATPVVRGAEGTAETASHTGIAMMGQPAGATAAQQDAATGPSVAGGRRRTMASLR